MIPQDLDARIDAETGYATEIAAEGRDVDSENQIILAGAGSLGGKLRRFIGPRSRPTLKRMQQRRLKGSEGMSPKDMEALGNRLRDKYGEGEIDPDMAADYQAEIAGEPTPTEKRTAERINIFRATEGAVSDPQMVEKMMQDPVAAMEMLENADHMSRMLEVFGRHQDLAQAPRTHAEIAEKTGSVSKSAKVLSDALLGGQKGLFSDVQLNAARNLLATVGATTHDLAQQIAGYARREDIPQELLMQYSRHVETGQALHALVKNQAREVARALSQQRMIAQVMRDPSMAGLTEITTGLGGVDHIVTHARTFAKTDPKDEEQALKQFAKFTSGVWRTSVGLAAEFWKASILSGPQTHFVNMMSNTAYQVWDTAVVRGVAAGVGEARQFTRKALGQEPDPAGSVTFQEWFAGMSSGLTGIYDGLEAMAITLATGESKFYTTLQKGGKVESQNQWQQAGAQLGGYVGEKVAGAQGSSLGQKIGEGAGTAVTLSFRFLEAEDELFKTVAFRSELTRLANREGLARGLRGEELEKYVAQVFDDPEANGFMEAAMDHARRLTFTDQQLGGLVGEMADATRKLVANHPLLQFIVPFINTPSNLVIAGLETGGLGLPLSKNMRDMYAAGGAQRDIAIAKTITGLGLTVGAWQMYESGILTGAGPDDPAQRKLLQAGGWEPSSVKIGDNWYSYNRLDPFAMSMGAVADYFDRAKSAPDEEQFKRYFMSAIFTMADHTMDATYMRGMSDLFATVRGQKSAEDYIANLAAPFTVPTQSFLPSSLGRTMTKVQRGPERKSKDPFTSTFGHAAAYQMRQQNPWLPPDQWSRPARFWDAQPVLPRPGEVGYQANNELLAFGTFPVQKRRARDDQTSRALAYHGVRVAEPPSVWTHPAVGQFSMFALDNGQGLIYDEYFKMAGKIRRERVEKFLGSRDYRALENEPGGWGENSHATTALTGILSAADIEARDRFLFGRPKSRLAEIIEEGNVNPSPEALALAEDPREFMRQIGTEQIDDETLKAVKPKRPGAGQGADVPRQVEMPQGPRF